MYVHVYSVAVTSTNQLVLEAEHSKEELHVHLEKQAAGTHKGDLCAEVLSDSPVT